jgi:hypothetical protein
MAKMLPMEVQRELVFRFKTVTVGKIPKMDEAERRIKQDIVCKMRAGATFCHGARGSLYLITLQKRFYDCMLAYDAHAAENAFEEYKLVTQSHLDSALFDEGTFTSVTLFSDANDAFIEHTKADDMAVTYGDAIRNTAEAMEEGLACLKKLRRTCAMAI